MPPVPTVGDSSTLVFLILFGDVPNGQDRDILRTRPGRVRDASGTCPAGDTFLGKFGKGHGTSLRNLKKDIGQIDPGQFWRCPKMVRTGKF